MSTIKNIILFLLFTLALNAKEYHIAKNGNDSNSGSVTHPFLSISKAALIAMPADTITVHEGIYREWIAPHNGGENEMSRILYRAAVGERVLVKGSEEVSAWELVEGSVWRKVLPNSFFGDYNPYSDVIVGDWFDSKGIKHHTGEVFMNGKSLYEKNNLEEVVAAKPYEDSRDPEQSIYTWYCEVDAEKTTLWANFQEANPNEALIEINVRPACFYPKRPGVNFIAVRGFEFDQAATQWAAPTAEQIGMIGTHWSKGWLIENNTISNSKCVGITLGKDRATGHNVASLDPNKGGADHYNEVIFRALEIGWSRNTIGSHLVRNNVIRNCGQAGIVGSLGAVYSQICHNHIYDIWVKRIFKGAEMGGIKIHAPIDMLIANNRIHNTGRGIWLDWMAQGTRVTQNLLYDNTSDDIFMEVNHGPSMVDNNILLSRTSIRDWSEGGAYAHNLISGRITYGDITARYTPYHLAHSTKVAGVINTRGGDNRFYNNIFVKQEYNNDDVDMDRIDAIFYGLDKYDMAKFPTYAEGNVFYAGAKPYKTEKNFVEFNKVKPQFSLEEKDDGVYLTVNVRSVATDINSQIVTTELLGVPVISRVIFENPDGSRMKIDKDYLGKGRKANPSPGPFSGLEKGTTVYKVW